MDYGVETIKRQAGTVLVVVWLWGYAGLAYSLYRLHVRPSLCRPSAAEVAVCDLRRYTSVICLCICFCLVLVVKIKKNNEALEIAYSPVWMTEENLGVLLVLSSYHNKLTSHKICNRLSLVSFIRT